MTDARDETLALLPCPFCDGRGMSLSEHEGYIVRCEHAYCRGHHPIEARARESWNRRTALPATDTGMREALEAALEFTREELDRREDGCFEKSGQAWVKYVEPARSIVTKLTTAIAALSRPSHVADTREGES